MKRKRKSKTNRKNPDDRISDFPESLIHQIISSLPRRDRSRTSVLSKTWYRMNKSYPALNFDLEHFFKHIIAVNSVSDHEIYVPEAMEIFRKRNKKSLRRFRRRNLRLHSLRVYNSINHYPQYESDLDDWILSALKSRVEKLKLHHPFDKPVYSLPEPVYFSATLTTLKLVQCVLSQPLSVFTSLKKLTLEKCCIDSGPIMLNHTDCTGLECLVIDKCSGFESVRVSNLAKLRRVEVLLKSPVVAGVIESQILEKITVGCYSYDDYWKDVRIYGCNRLKFLHLESGEITEDDFHSLISKLPLLEELYVVSCDRISTMEVACPKLKTLMVSLGMCSSLRSIEIAVPNLKNFIFLSDSWTERSVYIDVQGECSKGLENLVLSSYVMVDEDFHDLVSKFPLLQSLWVYGCVELERIKIPNVQLKRLHIERCSEMKAVEVDSCELVDVYFRGREDLEISVPDIATSNLRCDRMAGSTCNGYYVSVSLLEMLARVVKDKRVIYVIDAVCFGCVVDYKGNIIFPLLAP